MCLSSRDDTPLVLEHLFVYFSEVGSSMAQDPATVRTSKPIPNPENLTKCVCVTKTSMLEFMPCRWDRTNKQTNNPNPMSSKKQPLICWQRLLALPEQTLSSTPVEFCGTRCELTHKLRIQAVAPGSQGLGWGRSLSRSQKGFGVSWLLNTQTLD